MSRRFALCLVFLFAWGIIASWAFPPVSWWGLGWVALVPLWIAIHPQRSPSKVSSLMAGALWGLGFYGCSLTWILDLHPLMWMGVSEVNSLAIAGGVWLFLGLLGGLFSGTWALLFACVGNSLPLGLRLLVGVMLWALLEALWSHSPLWWLSLSLTQSPGNLWLLHLGQLSGPTLVTAVVVAINGLIAEALMVYGRDRTLPRSLWITPLILIIGTHGLGAGLMYSSVTEEGEPLKIGLIQGNIPTRMKLTPAGIRQAWERYSAGYEQLAAAGAEAVLTPEAALPIRWQPRQVNPLTQAISPLGVPLWLGTFIERNDQVYQSLITLNADGKQDSVYKKVKLVPLGEYVPVWLGGLVQRLSPLSANLSAGATDQRFDTPLGPAIVGICFESAFSYRFRDQAALGGEWILSVSNNDPYTYALMAQHHAQDVMRAIETDRWLVRATNTGLSAVIAPQGKTIWRSQILVFETHLATIYPRHTQTLYVRWEDWGMALLLIVTGGTWLYYKKLFFR